MSGNWTNIYVTYATAVVQKKIGTTSKNCPFFFRTPFGQKQRASIPHAQSSSLFLWKKQQKEIISFQELFTLSKYQVLTELYECECFPVLIFCCQNEPFLAEIALAGLFIVLKNRGNNLLKKMIPFFTRKCILKHCVWIRSFINIRHHVSLIGITIVQ